MDMKKAAQSQWFQAERSGQQELAEMIFASLVKNLPAIEPRADFVDRVVQSTWRTRTQRRLRVAAFLVVAAGSAVVYALVPFAAALIVSGTILISHSLVWLVASASEGARWWWIAERIGTAARDAMSAPSAIAAIGVAEMILLFGIHVFRHVLGDDYEKRTLD